MAKHDEHDYNIDQISMYSRVPKTLVADLRDASPLIPNLTVNVFRLYVNLQYLHEATKKIKTLTRNKSNVPKAELNTKLSRAIGEVSSSRIVVRGLIKTLQESLR